jgi:hypothetical protein
MELSVSTTLNRLQLVPNHEFNFFLSYGRRNYKVTLGLKSIFSLYNPNFYGVMIHQNIYRDPLFHYIEFLKDSDTKNQ